MRRTRSSDSRRPSRASETTIFGVLIAKALFWGSFGALAWTQVGYPVAAAALARVRGRPVRTDGSTPSVSLIIAAHNLSLIHI